MCLFIDPLLVCPLRVNIIITYDVSCMHGSILQVGFLASKAYIAAVLICNMQTSLKSTVL